MKRMQIPSAQISPDNNNTRRRFASWLLVAFAGLALASCVTTDGRVEPTAGQNDTTLKVVDVSHDISQNDWFRSQGVFRTRLFIRFNKPVDTSTFNRITFNYTITGLDDGTVATMTGRFQFNDSKTIVGFESDKSLSEFLGRQVHPGEDTKHRLRLRGTDGPITDRDGNVWPYSGIYSAPDTNPQGGIGTTPTNSRSRPRSKLLDGDSNNEPGGNYLKSWVIIG